MLRGLLPDTTPPGQQHAACLPHKWTAMERPTCQAEDARRERAPRVGCNIPSIPKGGGGGGGRGAVRAPACLLVFPFWPPSHVNHGTTQRTDRMENQMAATRVDDLKIKIFVRTVELVPGPGTSMQTFRPRGQCCCSATSATLTNGDACWPSHTILVLMYERSFRAIKGLYHLVNVEVINDRD